MTLRQQLTLKEVTLGCLRGDNLCIFLSVYYTLWPLQSVAFFYTSSCMIKLNISVQPDFSSEMIKLRREEKIYLEKIQTQVSS